MSAATKVKPFKIVCDTREQRPPPLPEGYVYTFDTLGEGDYSTPRLMGRAVIERKSCDDYLASITWERERFRRELERLREYKFRAILVESSLDVAMRRGRVHPNAVLGSTVALIADGYPVIWCEDAERAGVMLCKILRRLDDKSAEREAEQQRREEERRRIAETMTPENQALIKAQLEQTIRDLEALP